MCFTPFGSHVRPGTNCDVLIIGTLIKHIDFMGHKTPNQPPFPGLGSNSPVSLSFPYGCEGTCILGMKRADDLSDNWE